MLRINCEDKNPKKRIDLSKIKKVTKGILRQLNKKDAELNIIFVSNQKIRAINRRYLGIDAATDVIAFWQENGMWLQEDFLGDIVVSSDKVMQNAGKYKVSFNEETALCIIHGILHLLGHKDKTRAGKNRMRKLENELIQKIRKSL